jgi:glycine C-acetyltransferase/8-amino-7-oxononanoate synthase
VAELGLEGEVDVVVGTLGKSLGSYGAYACCDAAMGRYLINTARTLIFSTALPPPAVAGAMAALELLVEQPRRVEKLQANACVLRDELEALGFDTGDSCTQVVPLVVGDAAEAMRACERALEHGVFAQAIRPPTVPEGTSRLRLAVMGSHSKSELRSAARVLADAVGEAASQAEPAVAQTVSVPAPILFDGQADERVAA